MSERSDYAPGEFSWVDLAAGDADAAAKFYGDLLDCDANPAGPAEETGGYGFFSRDGKMLAGYGPTQSDQQPTAWSSYIRVADAEESAAKVSEAGGTVVMGPIDLPNESGRMALCQDPEGAFFSILEQIKHAGAELVNEVGCWTWNQLMTRDINRARKFYGDVFGWTFDPSENSAAGTPYWMLQVEGQRFEEGMAGAMEIGEALPAEVPAHWMVYFGVEDADAAAKQTADAGGAVMAKPMDISVGRMTVLSDPQGAVFAAIKPDYPGPR